jgi:hypothetical protein
VPLNFLSSLVSKFLLIISKSQFPSGPLFPSGALAESCLRITDRKSALNLSAETSQLHKTLFLISSWDVCIVMQ